MPSRSCAWLVGVLVCPSAWPLGPARPSSFLSSSQSAHRPARPPLRAGPETAAATPKEAEEDVLQALEAEFWASLNETERKIESKTRAGILYLRAGQVDDAIASLDAARALSNGVDKRFLFHRGVALFLAARFDEAAADFREHADIYEARFEEPATEERLLALVADRLSSSGSSSGTTAAAREKDESEDDDDDDDEALVERRPVFRVVRDVFEGKATPSALVQFAETEPVKAPDAKMPFSRAAQPDPLRRELYSHFYAGLFWETERDEARAYAHMTLAAGRAAQMKARSKKKTAGIDNDITLDLPRLHIDARGWPRRPDGPPNDADLGRAEQFQ